MTLSACTLSEADVIPDKLGEAEGLWLYYENTRALSDGTEQTELLKAVEIDGIEYGTGEFEITYTAYAVNTKEIFYVIIADENVCAYHYNYGTGQSGYLCSLNSDYVQLEVSESYVLYTSSQDGILFNHELTVIDGDFTDFNISDDIVSKWDTKNNDLIYFDGSEIRKFSSHVAQVRPTVCGIYIYDFDQNVSVNTRTGEQFSLECIEDSQPKLYVADGTVYALMRNVYDYSLYKFVDGKAIFLYDFGECKYVKGIEMTGLKFKVYGDRTKDDKYYVYNPDNGKMNKISSSEYYQSKEEKHYRTIEVEGYTFYLTFKDYGGSAIGALTPSKTCCYLNREKDGKTEIMQYLLDVPGGTRYFYDDIC
ncbi:MAG: hypothetical protein K2O41_02255, partial [Clostridia bacterium]|nr:hypothetical protein [Clostridia bacterium]